MQMLSSSDSLHYRILTHTVRDSYLNTGVSARLSIHLCLGWYTKTPKLDHFQTTEIYFLEFRKSKIQKPKPDVWRGPSPGSWTCNCCFTVSSLVEGYVSLSGTAFKVHLLHSQRFHRHVPVTSQIPNLLPLWSRQQDWKLLIRERCHQPTFPSDLLKVADSLTSHAL